MSRTLRQDGFESGESASAISVATFGSVFVKK
jgi:hypothetical protein